MNASESNTFFIFSLYQSDKLGDMSIQETLLKIKRVGDLPRIAWESFILGVILSIAFFLGRVSVKKTEFQTLSNVQQNQSNINLTIPRYQKNEVGDLNQSSLPQKNIAPQNQTVETNSETNQNFVASKTGKVYYPNSCKALNRIKSANRIYFATASDAQAKHLTLSKSCK